MSTNKFRLTAGTRVRFDGRSQGVKESVVQKREAIPAYRSGDPDIVYYHVAGEALLVPAVDVLEVLN